MGHVGIHRHGWVSLVAALIASPALGADSAEVVAASPVSDAGAATQPASAETGAALPTVMVTAQKQAQDAQRVPASMTVVGPATMRDAGVMGVRDASLYVPNLFVEEFTARRLSFPFVRGVGSGPANPSVTTYIDGVPQLHASTSSMELLRVERIEFLRGPQGTLYGRNTLGGVVNIVTRKPSHVWTGSVQGSAGNYSMQDYRLDVSGPVVDDTLAVGFAGNYGTREGYTINELDGRDVDSREAFAGRASLRYTPTEELEIVLSTSGERARDGDFALGDLDYIRQNPHRVQHDFTAGFTHRDMADVSLAVQYHGEGVEVTSVTGFSWWTSTELTDLDAGAADQLARQNREMQRSITQEFRVGSAADAPIELASEATLHWLAGVFAFGSNFDQEATNSFMPTALGLGTFPAQISTGKLNDFGAGVFGQGTVTFWDKLDLTAGLRLDYENKAAELSSTTFLPGFSADSLDRDRDFHSVSPRFAAAYRLTEDAMVYASMARGYKAGGFNAAGPAGVESYDQESSWTYEVGIKTQWLDRRLVVNAAAFYMDWDDLQLDTPSLPTGSYIANAGQAVSQGFETEATFRLMPGWDVFAGLGYTQAQFLGGAMASGADVGGNDMPFAPETTWNVGTQASVRWVRGLTLYGRAEVVGYGQYFYDAGNGAKQDSYTLANFRVGLRGGMWRVEGWVRNALDTQYVPLAFPFPGVAPSGYVGESGAPLTFGVTAAIEF